MTLKRVGLGRKAGLGVKSGRLKPSRGLQNASGRTKPLKPRKRRKKGETAKLKAQLWDLCRQIQIKRYGNTCYCCGATNLQGSNLHLGHFIPSSLCSMELRFELTNLKPSCYRCNIHLSGNWIGYESHLKKDGIDIEALKRRNEETKGLTYGNDWLRAKISEYENILKSA